VPQTEIKWHILVKPPTIQFHECQTVIQLLHAEREMQREINGRSVAALRSARASKRVNRPITEHVRFHAKTNKQTTRP